MVLPKAWLTVGVVAHAAPANASAAINPAAKVRGMALSAMVAPATMLMVWDLMRAQLGAAADGSAVRSGGAAVRRARRVPRERPAQFPLDGVASHRVASERVRISAMTRTKGASERGAMTGMSGKE